MIPKTSWKLKRISCYSATLNYKTSINLLFNWVMETNEVAEKFMIILIFINSVQFLHCILKHSIKRLMVQTQWNECQKKCTIAKQVKCSGGSVEAHLSQVSKRSLLIPWQTKFGTIWNEKLLLRDIKSGKYQNEMLLQLNGQILPVWFKQTVGHFLETLRCQFFKEAAQNENCYSNRYSY